MRKTTLVSALMGLFLHSLPGAQAVPQEKGLPIVAVIDFEGDQTVTHEQLQFITGKMASELIRTKAFTVLDRSRMEFILKEQGFQQSGACSSSDCRVQVGQLLGVDNLVAGNLVKFGPTYMLRLDYLDVQSGQILQSVDLQMKGELYEIVGDLCRKVATQLAGAVHGKNDTAAATPAPEPEPLVEQQPIPTPEETAAQSQTGANSASVPRSAIVAEAVPKDNTKPLSLKRKIALGLAGVAVLGGGSGYYFNNNGNGYKDDFDAAVASQDPEQLQKASDNLDNAELYRNASYGVAIGSLVVGAVLWFWPEGGAQ